MSTLYAVYSLRLAGYLMLNGVPIIKIVPDNKDKTKNNFIFVNNEKLHSLIDEWNLQKKQK